MDLAYLELALKYSQISVIEVLVYSNYGFPAVTNKDLKQNIFTYDDTFVCLERLYWGSVHINFLTILMQRFNVIKVSGDVSSMC